MQKQYTISGMTCGGCVAKVQKSLERIPGVISAQVQLDTPQGVITTTKEIPVEQLQNELQTAGSYTIQEIAPPAHNEVEVDLPEKSILTYKPLILIVSFVAGISMVVQYPFEEFSGMLWMRYFMAGFFIVFSFFKLLNLEGFANSYRMYDLVAAKWNGWGYIYPFVELVLGLLYLTNMFPFETNLATAIILGISSIGVIKSNLNKQKIKCACLGDVFNLPMSTVTVVEDLTMVGMAVWMLIIM
ncbi:cation transporter [bacterium SCSIO 12741]|nr:cation transporter [bacterium SCSIO 12741]